RAAYLASQIGLIGFTHACAHEFAPFNIRVNAICRTLNVAGSLRDYAAPFEAASSDPVELAVFLCSDAAAAIHGRVIATHFESEKETS
ncbi:MAG TPA: SDR family oxidoreductase, partial [Anaerolineae bacterium]